MVPLILGCAPAPDAGAVTPVEVLVRASLDVRGIRPLDAEVAAVQADPAALEPLLDDLLQDERFERRVRELWAVPFRTRIDAFPASAAQFGVGDDAAWAAAIGEEPLRILGRVAADDRPWTDVVTADWTLVPDVLADVWPVDYPEGATGWQQVRYLDGRPAAGVLATNGLWWRYGSTIENYNRGRANAVARILLCSDFLVRPVTFSRSAVSLEDASALEAQTQTNTNCTTCHVALDPLGSYLAGFSYFSNDFVSPTYNLAAEATWRGGTGVAPSYFGHPGYSLADLGRQVAADPRFVSCAVETTYEGLLGRETTTDDLPALVTHREAFLAGGLTMRALFRSILDDPAYRAGDTDVAGGVPSRLLPVEVYASAVEDLTGFRWTYAGYDMLGTDTYGLRTLGGGMDGEAVTAPADAPTPTVVLVQERVAQLAALTAVESGTLDIGVDWSAEGTAASRREGFVALRRRVLQAEAEGVALDEDAALWDEIHATTGDPRLAWAAVLTLLLRDPAFVTY